MTKPVAHYTSVVIATSDCSSAGDETEKYNGEDPTMAPSVLSRDKTVKPIPTSPVPLPPSVPPGHMNQNSRVRSPLDVCGDGAAGAGWRCSARPRPHPVPGLLALSWGPPEGLQLVKPP